MLEVVSDLHVTASFLYSKKHGLIERLMERERAKTSIINRDHLYGGICTGLQNFSFGKRVRSRDQIRCLAQGFRLGLALTHLCGPGYFFTRMALFVISTCCSFGLIF